jgi:hypothetical protein
MALLIKQTGIKTTSGIELPVGANANDGIFVKFAPKGSFDGFNQIFDLAYFSSYTNKIDGFQPIQIMYDDSVVPNQLLKEITPEQMAQYRAMIDAAYPNLTWDIKIVIAYHIMVKQLLEVIFGKDTVIIRPDLQ